MTVARRGTAALIGVAVAAIAVSGCGLQVPRDPDGTLDRVTGGELRVGVSGSGPQVGRERDLVERFAEELDAEVDWQEGGEEALMTALDDDRLDLVIGALTDQTPWSTHAAITRPYDEGAGADGRPVAYVMAAPLGENAFLVELETFLEEQAP
jgi:polar amino acid transport system substrate-binding protein